LVARNVGDVDLTTGLVMFGSGKGGKDRVTALWIVPGGCWLHIYGLNARTLRCGAHTRTSHTGWRTCASRWCIVVEHAWRRSLNS